MLVLTLNTWNTQGPYGERMKDLRRYLVMVRPDVIAFQEVPFEGATSRIESVLDGLGYTSHYRMAGWWNGQVEGLAIATRFPSRVCAAVALSPAEGEIDRAMLCVEGSSADCGSLLLATTHLASKLDHGDDRRRQAQECTEVLSSALSSHGAVSTVVACDLNEGPGGAAYREFLDVERLGLRDAWAFSRAGEGVSVDARNPWADLAAGTGRRLDYLFVSRGLEVQWADLAMCGSDGWPAVSDHYGVLARLRLSQEFDDPSSATSGAVRRRSP